MLNIPEQPNGLMKIRDIWLSWPSCEYDKIIDNLAIYKIHNEIDLRELTCTLLEVLIEEIEDRLRELSPTEIAEKDEIQLALEERCRNEQNRLNQTIN